MFARTCDVHAVHARQSEESVRRLKHVCMVCAHDDAHAQAITFACGHGCDCLREDDRSCVCEYGDWRRLR
eukprot:4714321-Alexandrium_andersonii.AAC.1